jgi:outer membrane protein TolC
MSKIIAFLFWYLSFTTVIAQKVDTSALSLNECTDAALHNNPRVKESENEVNISNLDFKTAQSGMRPVISAEASGGLSDQYKWGNNYRIANASISANQILWQKGMVKSSIKEAGYVQESTKSSLKAQLQEITLAVKTSYINCVLQDQLYNNTLDNVAKARLFLDYANERYRIGAARKSDILKAESDMAEAEYESSNYRNSREQARNELAMLTGLPVQRLTRLENLPEQQMEEFTEIADSLHRNAIKNYPELLAIENMERAQQAKIGQANAALYPQLSVRGGYDWSYNPTLKEQKGWYTVVALRWDIFNGNERRHRIQTEQVRESIYKNQSEQVRILLIKEINNKLIDLKQAEEQIALSIRLITSTSANLEIAKAQYTTGTGSMLELTDARINDLKAKQRNIQAVASYQMAKANLERLTNNTYDN